MDLEDEAWAPFPLLNSKRPLPELRRLWIARPKASVLSSSRQSPKASETCALHSFLLSQALDSAQAEGASKEQALFGNGELRPESRDSHDSLLDPECSSAQCDNGNQNLSCNAR